MNEATRGRSAGSRRGLRMLARSQTEAFVDQPQVRFAFPVMRRPLFRAAITVQLLVAELRRNEVGTASLVLLPHGFRAPGTAVRAVCLAAAWLVAIVTVVLTAGAVVGPEVVLWAVLALLVTFLLVVAPPALWRWGRGRKARKKLRAMRPASPYWMVVSMASVDPGQGGLLLEQLAIEADRNGWLLVLEAANPKLADYYTDFGFVPAGEGVTMPWLDNGPDGEPGPCVATCMVRQAATR